MLDAVMSQTQLEKKVEGYLRNSQALEDYWQRPITAEQLQVELERMARHTRQPEVLRELFEALGNDSFVIAECLARPALSKRLITNWYSYDQRFHGELRQRAEADLRAHNTVEQMKQASGKYSEIELIRSDGTQDEHKSEAEHGPKLNSREWDETQQRLAALFGDHENRNLRMSRAVAAGVSPGKDAPIMQIKTGLLSPLQEDETRYYGVAVISKAKERLKLATVAWLKEPLESWVVRAESQVRSGLVVPSANYTLPTMSPGGCIDDTWTATAGLRARAGHTAVWTGNEMIVWGGRSDIFDLNTGDRYNPSTDSWTATSTTNAPDARDLCTVVWTGTEMIVWGGGSFTGLNTGAKYNPGTDSWVATSTTNAPAARYDHTAVWTGSEMIVWGGYSDQNRLNIGGKYDPVTDSWTATTTTNAPSARGQHTAVWTGSEMIVWGGWIADNPFGTTNTGGRYNPGTDSWVATSISNAPDARSNHTAIWTDKGEMIVWGGTALGGQFFNTGGRYNPGTDSWVTTSTTNAPAGRYGHTAVWTGKGEMIVWGGTGFFFQYLNTGGRYNPSTNSWTPTSTNNAPSVRDYQAAVWTGNEMIVWGGFDGGALNSGGRYDPTINSWTPTNVPYVPNARADHTAIWTGSEMIVWGGLFSTELNTGGRYDPATDTWTPTSMLNPPDPRVNHTAVWTGKEMIVWGDLKMSPAI